MELPLVKSRTVKHKIAPKQACARVQLMYVALLMHYGCKHDGVGMWVLAACRLRSVGRGDAVNWLKFERFQSGFKLRVLSLTPHGSQ